MAQVAAVANPPAPPRRRRAPATPRRLPYLLIAPAALLMLGFIAHPVISVFYYSLQNFNPTKPWRNGFAGFDNFVQIFTKDTKAMLIGNDDSATGNRGKRRVTLHHNRFESVVQRAPRVRSGQVRVDDNRYVVPEGSERDVTADPGWTPTLHTKIGSAEEADREVAHGAGAGRTP
ncbi:hypothetical protein AB0N07_19910 [Streptomyces sp. NPDC051172]|uniref:pectate lyase family protein n=1 Tax=Streptomyces sp. NPDC051172 TaxID=3155796 RepID=UPI00342C3574